MEVLHLIRKGDLATAVEEAAKLRTHLTNSPDAKIQSILRKVDPLEFTYNTYINLTELDSTYIHNVSLKPTSWNLTYDTIKTCVLSKKSCIPDSLTKGKASDFVIKSKSALFPDLQISSVSANATGILKFCRDNQLTSPDQLSQTDRIWVWLFCVIRSETETFSGSMVRHHRWLWILFNSTIPRRFCVNPFIRMIKYLYDQDALNFVESSSGLIKYDKIENLSTACMPKIYSILLTLAFGWFNGRFNADKSEALREMRFSTQLAQMDEKFLAPDFPSIEEVGLEIANYILLDPVFNSLDFKKQSQVVSKYMLSCNEGGKWIKCVCPATESGEIINPEFVRCDCKTLSPDTAIKYHNKFRKHLKKFSETFPKTGKWYDYLASSSATCCPLLVDLACNLKSPYLCVGYIQGHKGRAAIEHLKPENIAKPDRSSKFYHRFQEIIFSIWENAALEMIEFKYFPRDINEFYNSLIPALTTKGSGVQKEDVLGIIRGREVTIKASNKAWVYFTQYEKMHQQLITGNYMDDNNRIGFRSDVGRKLRAILNMPLPQYLAEQVIAPAVKRWQMRQPQFTLRTSSEKVTANHSYIYRYCNGAGNHIFVGRDFDAMDSHASYEVFRESALKGIVSAFRKKASSLREIEGFDFALRAYEGVKDGPLSGFEAFFSRTYSFMRNTKFVSQDCPDEVFTLDAVLSGEALTINWHNMTNDAFSKLVNEELINHPILSKMGVKLKYRSFTGDDSIEVFYLEGFNAKWSSKALGALYDTLSAISTATGFPMNLDKLFISTRGGEYLKKHIQNGFYWPLTGRLHFFMSERSQMHTDRISLLSSFSDKLAEYYTRGGYSEFLLQFMWATGSICLDIAVRDSISGKRKIGTIPITAALIPKSHGGLGWSPYTIFYTSSQLIFEELALYDPTEIGYALKVCAAVKSARSSVDVLKSFPSLGQGVSSVTRTLDDIRLRNESKAREALIRKGKFHLVQNLSYSSSAQRIVRQVTENVSDLQDLREIMYGSMIDAIPERHSSDTFGHVVSAYAIDVKISLFAPSKVPVCIMPTYESHMAHVQGVMGPPFLSESNESPLNTLKSIVDSKFPRSTTLQNVAEVIFSAGMQRDQEDIANALIFMGADPARAIKLSKRIVSSGISSLDVHNMSQWSMTNPILSFFDMSSSNRQRFVSLHLDDRIDRELNQYWFLRSISFIFQFGRDANVVRMD